MLLQTNSMAFREISDEMAPYPREVSGIPQTSLGLLGHLITNLPQAMLLLMHEDYSSLILLL